jgi:hypothetical protein
MDLFPSSGEEMETSTLLGLIERANLNHIYLKSKNQVILSVRQHRQNPLESNKKRILNFCVCPITKFYTQTL